MKRNGLTWSVVCGTRRNGKQNSSVGMAFKYVVTHIADNNILGIVVLLVETRLAVVGSSPTDAPLNFPYLKN